MTLRERTNDQGQLKEVIQIGSNTHTRMLMSDVAYMYYNRLQDTFEVFTRNKHTSSSEFTGQVEGHERFPSNEQFGAWAWSYMSRDRATERFNRLTHGVV